MIVFPNAKINIGLSIVSKRSDGYHNLETVFYPVSVTDALEMAAARELKLTATGIQLDNNAGENLVLRAWSAMEKDFDLPPVHFHLHKVIPFGAGLGGGSSDAAFTLKMVNEFFGLQLNAEELKKYARQIGADCSFFIENRPAFASGTGTYLNPIEIDLSQYQIVLLKPNLSVSTPDAYKHVQPAPASFNLKRLADLHPGQWKNVVVNDFEKSVFQMYPVVKECKEILYKMGALFASMSGSGSAVYGIFRHLPADFDKFIPKGVFVYR